MAMINYNIRKANCIANGLVLQIIAFNTYFPSLCHEIIGVGVPSNSASRRSGWFKEATIFDGGFFVNLGGTVIFCGLGSILTGKINSLTPEGLLATQR